ncbi:MAG: hypothetical protein DI556_07825 [Rhodovulum sulfidophilum]|uniref:Peptidase M10 serralysin C-terminal domain-containing protein n=1 Tax=Rhodovulum sulfidophilum TaxID=35806 RepID=A0A2W5NAC2_RHOSU|nr:MAG: hypothetical protein DI556_07825 [Rhodovulum sulfidophilum]
MLTGTKVRLGIFAPTREQAIARAVSKTITRAAVEFADTSAYDTTGDDLVVPASIDIAGGRVVARILAEEGAFRNVNDKTGFNGFTLTFAALTGDPRAEIRAVEVVRGASAEGIGAAKIRFDHDTLSVNLDDLAFGRGDALTLRLGLKLTGTARADKLAGYEGDDALHGHAGADELRGNKGNDLLAGGSGDDLLLGGSGRDTLRGGAGEDRLVAGPGADVLIGGAGADRLDGGGGADRFVFQSVAESGPTAATRDRIGDFVAGEDRIDLAGIDANVGRSGNQAFRLIGDDPFSGAAGELRVFERATGTFVTGDVDGDGRADFSIQLSGRPELDAADFLL